MRKSTKRELSKYLKQATKAELEKEIKKLYDKFKDVKQYYELEFTNDTTEIVNKHKAAIKKEYFPSRGYGKARNGVSRKVITDFKKIAIFQKDVIDLLLYRVEMMLEYTNTYGDIDEAFYNSLERSFDEACRLIQQEKLEKEYRIYCEELIDQTNNFGWGVYDAMQYSFEHYLGFS
ncbi:MAG: DUF6155 family protein [Bacteroidota bacterium]